MSVGVRGTGPVLVALVALVGLAACADGLTGPIRDSAAPVQTDRLVYALDRSLVQLQGGGEVSEYATTITYSFTNTTGSTINIEYCESPGFFLDKEGEDHQWTRVWYGSDYEHCVTPPVVLQPGERYDGVLAVHGFEPNRSLLPQFSTSELDGVFRLVLAGAVHPRKVGNYYIGEPVDGRYLYSNAFRLEVR